MKLTQIVKIEKLTPIEGADRIETARVLSWDCVVQKGTHQVGELALFVFPDTLIPKRFLDSAYEGDEKVRLKVIKLKGQYSAGLLLPLNKIKRYLPENVACEEGSDLAEFLGVEKYEKPIPVQLAGQVMGDFPTHLVNKTDEDNYRSNPEAVAELLALDTEVVITTKMDGSSFTGYVDPADGQFKVCSRNLILKENDTNTFWLAAKKFRIEEAIRTYGSNLAIQAEMCGPGINGNNMGLKELKLFIFLIKDLKENRWFSWKEVKDFCKNFPHLETVPEIKVCKANQLNFEELQAMADTLQYPNQKLAEGLVVRTVNPVPSKALQKFWLSLKVISQPYAKKYD
jgi:RNA ligase (TIGR02306 family)